MPVCGTTESPYTEHHNRLVGFDMNAPSPAANAAFPNLTGALEFASPSDRYVYNWYKAGFGPRFGLAYQAAKNTVIRAGAGVFYAPLQISNNAVGFSPSSGFSSSTPLTASINGGLTPFNIAWPARSLPAWCRRRALRLERPRSWGRELRCGTAIRLCRDHTSGTSTCSTKCRGTC